MYIYSCQNRQASQSDWNPDNFTNLQIVNLLSYKLKIMANQYGALCTFMYSTGMERDNDDDDEDKK